MLLLSSLPLEESCARETGGSGDEDRLAEAGHMCLEVAERLRRGAKASGTGMQAAKTGLLLVCHAGGRECTLYGDDASDAGRRTTSTVGKSAHLRTQSTVGDAYPPCTCAWPPGRNSRRGRRVRRDSGGGSIEVEDDGVVLRGDVLVEVASDGNAHARLTDAVERSSRRGR